jgi:hypothetical protein
MGLKDLIVEASNIIESFLVPLAFALSLLYFFWGIAKYIRTDAGSEKAVEQGRNVIFWGLIGMFVAISIWGIVALLKSELEIPDIESIDNVSARIY